MNVLQYLFLTSFEYVRKHRHRNFKGKSVCANMNFKFTNENLDCSSCHRKKQNGQLQPSNAAQILDIFKPVTYTGLNNALKPQFSEMFCKRSSSLKDLLRTCLFFFALLAKVFFCLSHTKLLRH